MSKFISIRQYARERGISDVAVGKAIKAGHIYGDALLIENGKNRGINPVIADQQWKKTINPSQSRKKNLEERFIHAKEEHEYKESETFSEQKSAPSTAKAHQIEAVFKAKLRELEYRKKSGELISKDATYRSLFAIGQEIRSSLQAIPDRIIDEVLAAPTRNDAHTILSREIHDVLSRLSTISEKGILENL